jgi:hypothetical protein
MSKDLSAWEGPVTWPQGSQFPVFYVFGTALSVPSCTIILARIPSGRFSGLAGARSGGCPTFPLKIDCLLPVLGSH